jgi:phospholipid transport system substrate-binding protein
MDFRGADCARGSWRACRWRRGTARAAGAGDEGRAGHVEGSRRAPLGVQKKKKNPNRVRELVDKNMLPHFDTAYAAQLVLAKYWREASAEQRKRFVEAFYQSLLQNYGEALVEFTPDRLRILPFQGNPKDKVATVRSEVRRDNGTRVPVNYSLRHTPQGWKAYDVTIEGVSYVKSFRTDFSSEIQQKGLEAVIKRLENQVASGTVAKPTASS